MIANVCKAILAGMLLISVGYGHDDDRRKLHSACSDSLDLPDGRLFLFGEMHGSVETPALISKVACSLADSGDTAIGLEIPAEEQGLIDEYLKSPGTAEDKRRLTSGKFWQQGWDGRSSEAVLHLLDDLRKLKSGGGRLHVFAFDEQVDDTTPRDVAIANGIRRFYDKHPNERIVALMGNVHAMQETITIGSETIVPSGMLLKDLRPVSILVAYPKGSVWSCMPDCGVHEIPAAKSFGSPGLSRGTSPNGYDYTFSLSAMTASPPAVRIAP